MTTERKNAIATAASWTWRNVLASKTVWGVTMIITAPLTGPLAPGMATAGKLLTGIGIADKAVKNYAVIGSAIGGLMAALIKRNDKEKSNG